MTETVNVEVSEGLIRPIIEAKIRAAIVAEMSKDPQQLIDAMVTEALCYKVGKDGKLSNYSSDNKYAWLSVVMQNAIRAEAKRALEEMLIENRDKIKNSIKAMLKRESGLNKIASAVINGMTESLACKYSSKIEVIFETPKD